MAESYALTPLMKQYKGFKAKHPDAILLFRVGDFYETFEEDAVKTSKILGITLAKRANGAAAFVNLAGFPYHAIDNYLPKLVRAGERVAICEQLEDPKLTKTIVKRGIVEVITPGINLSENVLIHKENNYLASVYEEKGVYGISFLDISTGEMLTNEGSKDDILRFLNSLNPKEIIVSKGQRFHFENILDANQHLYPVEDWAFNKDTAQNNILKHFEIDTLKGLGIESKDKAICSLGAIFFYLNITEHNQIKHITKIALLQSSDYMWLDKFTIRNLEIFNSIYKDSKCLIDIIDKTITAFGGRMLKRWLAFPLKNAEKINIRLNIVKFFYQNIDLQEKIINYLKQISDIERICSKIATQRILPRELVQLKISLEQINLIKITLVNTENEYLKNYLSKLDPCFDVIKRIEKDILPEPANQIGKGNVINSGVSSELDELRELLTHNKEIIAEMQRKEANRTGISSLKISFNNVFGYYIEVTNAHKDKVPAEWIRKQTLTNAERYITEELKEYEVKILSAEEKILELEKKIYSDLNLFLLNYIAKLQETAKITAFVDVLLSFAVLAIENNYACPELNDGLEIEIIEGRHPFIEKQLPIGEMYVPNNLLINSDKEQVLIITGPNMAGKSAYLRQNALIVLLAQIGSFVPAKSAKIGLVDKIFTRVGASDNIALGESTFMVEMIESANILNNISEKSLILFDELGRGTSTFDGISIAWAVIEYILEHHTCKARTIFATHYHELNEMTKFYDRIKNYHTKIQEIGDKILFIRKIEEGGSEHSFGINVAQLAGVPKSIIKRAKEILKTLENKEDKAEIKSISKNSTEIAHNKEGLQFKMFDIADPILKELRNDILNIDMENITALNAFEILKKIKEKLGK